MIAIIAALLVAVAGLIWLGSVLVRRDRQIAVLKKQGDMTLDAWQESIHQRSRLQLELISVKKQLDEKTRQLDVARESTVSLSYRWPGWTTNPSPPPISDAPPYIPLDEDWDEKRH